ncbi:MAG: endonuclease VIII [Acidobacteria bacterium]|nr:endonuclease VIII [Acidobacteriota bacterium]
MLELPETNCIAEQIAGSFGKSKISSVLAAHTPHKLTWYFGNFEKYPELLIGKTIGKASGCGSMVEIYAGKSILLFSEGVGLRFHDRKEPRPERHQLLIEFDNGTALSAAVQMYGGLGCLAEGKLDNPYYKAAKEKPSPFSRGFGKSYFARLIGDPAVQKLSAKAFLATGQRIPGLGNGVLQDILFNAGIHPKKKVSTLSLAERNELYDSIRTTLHAMLKGGGRDTESDLYGIRGRYKTILSKNTAGKPCLLCGTPIKKESYLGGSIYFCPKCQPL